MEDKLDLINVNCQDTFIFNGILSYEPMCCVNVNLNMSKKFKI